MRGVYTIVDAESWLLGSAAVVLLALFVARHRVPAVAAARVLRSRDVVGANVVLMGAVAGMRAMSFLAVLYLPGVLGYHAFTTGVSFLPVSLGIGVLSLGFSAWLIMRFGGRLVLLPALALMGAGLCSSARPGWMGATSSTSFPPRCS